MGVGFPVYLRNEECYDSDKKWDRRIDHKLGDRFEKLVAWV
jgi:hypothetical protein